MLQLPPFTPQQPLPDVQITPQKWKSNPEFRTKHDDFYARARECDDERPFFNVEYNNTAPPNPPKLALRTDLPPRNLLHTRNRTRSSPGFSPQLTYYVTERILITIQNMMRK